MSKEFKENCKAIAKEFHKIKIQNKFWQARVMAFIRKYYKNNKSDIDNMCKSMEVIVKDE